MNGENGKLREYKKMWQEHEQGSQRQRDWNEVDGAAIVAPNVLFWATRFNMGNLGRQCGSTTKTALYV